VVQHKVADVVVKVEVFSDLTFGLLDDLKGPTQLAHDDPAPLSANGLTRGRRLVLYYCISQKSAHTNISHFKCRYLNKLPTQKLVHIQGLDVVALAVNVLLIYFGQTARHIGKESESGGRISQSLGILHYFHICFKNNPTLQGDKALGRQHDSQRTQLVQN